MVLNPGLYAALRTLNKGRNPRVSNAGMPARFTITQNGRTRQIHAEGESYAIDCVNCSDTRCRLYVHHCYGTTRFIPGFHEDGKPAQLLMLAYCQNEGKRIQLQKYLDGYVASHKDSASATLDFLNSQCSAPVPAPVCPTMGMCIPVHEMDPADRAVQYLIGRNFNIEYLGRVAGAVVMIQHPDGDIERLTRGRIGFPFYVDGVLKTWQARLPYDPDKKNKWPPKWWFPGAAGAKVPWNVDVASAFPVVIVNEGILSAVNMGPAAIAVGGKTITSASLDIIKRRWKKAIVAFDPDAGINRKPDKPGAPLPPDYQERAINLLRENGLEAVGVQWTPGDNRDPGDLTPRECIELLRRADPVMAATLSYVGVR